MSRRLRHYLPALLCLLILSWGTCPCVISKAFAEHPESAEDVTVGCPCCQDNQAEEGSRWPGLPEECPCSARSGANRPLPPVQADLVVPPMSMDAELWSPELPTNEWVAVAGEGWTWEATGPPTDRGLQGCPVGIVRLLN